MPPAVALAIRVGLVMCLGGGAIWMLKPPDGVGRSPAAVASAPPPAPAVTAPAAPPSPSTWAALPPAPPAAAVAAPPTPATPVEAARTAPEPARTQARLAAPGAPATPEPPKADPVRPEAPRAAPLAERPPVAAAVPAAAPVAAAPVAPVAAAPTAPERAPPLAARTQDVASAGADPAKPTEVKVDARRDDPGARTDSAPLAFAPQPAAAQPEPTAKTSPLLDDGVVDPPLPPAPARSIRRASVERPAVDRSGGRRCELFVPRGYRVGWRIRGGKPTSCYVERIR